MQRVVLSAVLAFTFYGCASSVKYISPDSQEYISASLDLNDIKKAAKEILNALFKSGYFQSLPFDPPSTLAVSDFVNDTTIKLDVEQITTRITEELQNSGKFQITRAMSGSGGNTDMMIDEARKARGNEEFNQESVIKKGQLISASLSLTGKIGQRITKLEDKQRVDYFFKIEINDLKSGLVKWSKTIDISKIAPDNASIW